MLNYLLSQAKQILISCFYKFHNFGLLSLILLNFFIITFISITSISLPIQAQASANLSSLQILNIDCMVGCENALLDNLLAFLRTLAIPLAVLVVMWGGYQYFAGGVDGKSDGRKAVQGAIFGLILVIGAEFFVNLISGGEEASGGIISNDGLNVEGITPFLENIQTILVSLSSLIAVLVIMWGGYKYFFTGLGASKEDGLKNIQNGIIGLAVIFFANTIVDLTSELGQALSSQEEGAINTILGGFLSQTISDVSSLLVSLASLVAILVIIWGGYNYFFSGLPISKKEGLENIKQGIIGLIVVILASPIINLIKATFPPEAQPATVEDGLFFNVQIDGFQQTLVFLIGDILIPISSLVSIFFIILGGYYWSSSDGDKGKVEKAEKAVRNAIIGLIVVLSATTVTQLIIFLVNN